jgi:hypothetical protein
MRSRHMADMLVFVINSGKGKLKEWPF